MTKLVTFLVDQEKLLFRPSSSLTARVAERLTELQTAKPSKLPPRDVRYCHWVPRATYDAHTRSYSQDAINRLLQSLVDDEKSDARRRRRRLQQFAKEYPDAFAARFPTAANFEALFPPPKRPTLLSALRIPGSAKK